MRLANLRNDMFILLRLTADRSLKLTIRGMPQENLNNIILFPAFYPQYKFHYCTSKILNLHLKEVFLGFQIWPVFDTGRTNSLRGIVDNQQLNLKTKEHLLQMKIKDLRSTVRELVLGDKGRKKDDVIQVLLRHASDCQL